MDTNYSQEILDALVRRIFSIDDFTLGDGKQGYLVAYHGHLITNDSEQAFNQLYDALASYQLMPLFRKEGDRQVIYIVSRIPDPKPSNPRINLVLFILTILSVIYAGMLYVMGDVFPKSVQDAWQAFLTGGLPFAIPMILILGTHELGHYFAGRQHKVQVTLPYFIPLPFSPFGTMGAFINMKTPTRNRRHLLDIAIAGPLAGLFVSIVVLIIGLAGSNLGTIPSTFPAGYGTQIEGNSLLYLFAKFVRFGLLLPSPAVQPASTLVYWLRYFFTGLPAPLGAKDVMLSPTAWAGWAGLLVTSLNLIPAGQLDGGHIFYALFGKDRARKLMPFILVILGLLGLAWNGWFL